MKFVCMKCETFMLFQKLDPLAETSLGVLFECPQCGSRFSMVTNPGETSLVHALGVQIGGRTTAPKPFELTRETLKEEREPAAETAKGTQVQSATATTSGSGCPFSAMLSSGQTQATEVAWSQEAKERLDRIPDFLRPMIQKGIEAYAHQKGYRNITPTVMDESKNQVGSSMEWMPEAEKRLESIPSFIRPMARKEVERMAQERGLDKVTETLMDEVKDKFTNWITY